jgi:predicted RNA binding protein YcfA (HicA-like mRNA interferase family)
MAKKVHEVITILEAHGWRQVRQRGSHRQFRSPNNRHVVTITGKRSATIAIGQLRAAKRISGIEDLR